MKHGENMDDVKRRREGGLVKRRVERSKRLGQVDILSPIFQIFLKFVCFKIFTLLNFKSATEVTQN